MEQPTPKSGKPDDPTRALSPWTVGAALCVGAGAWMVLEFIRRVVVP